MRTLAYHHYIDITWISLFTTLNHRLTYIKDSGVEHFAFFNVFLIVIHLFITRIEANILSSILDLHFKRQSRTHQKVRRDWNSPLGTKYPRFLSMIILIFLSSTYYININDIKTYFIFIYLKMYSGFTCKYVANK